MSILVNSIATNMYIMPYVKMHNDGAISVYVIVSSLRV